MNTLSRVPPGFRFFPTDEELVGYYLRKKVASKRFDLNVIKDVDLYKIEPWDLQEYCTIGSDEEQNEWHFFSHKDKKYPTGTRMNRATNRGFWKATGRDKPIYSKQNLIGMRKTLVYYIGRAPNGQKTDWIMHEYRLESNENGTSQEEGWVVCKAFKKRIPTTMMKGSHHDEIESSNFWFDNENIFVMPNPENYYNQNSMLPSEIPKMDVDREAEAQLVTVDWRILDKFVASQLSHDPINVPQDESQLILPQNCHSEFSN